MEFIRNVRAHLLRGLVCNMDDSRPPTGPPFNYGTRVLSIRHHGRRWGRPHLFFTYICNLHQLKLRLLFDRIDRITPRL
jgi:hypothetical protein